MQLEILRYGATVALGLAVDLAVAFIAATTFGTSLELAAALGVAAGAVFNFVMLKFWAFSSAESGLSASLRYLGAIGLTMAVRTGSVWAFGVFLPASTPPLVILSAATAISFAVNFLLSKYWVFRANTTQH